MALTALAQFSFLQPFKPAAERRQRVGASIWLVTLVRVDVRNDSWHLGIRCGSNLPMRIRGSDLPTLEKGEAEGLDEPLLMPGRSALISFFKAKPHRDRGDPYAHKLLSFRGR